MIVLVIVLVSLLLSACGGTGLDDKSFFNLTTVPARYGNGGYEVRILPIDFSEIPTDLSADYVAYYAVFKLSNSQYTFERIFVGSNFENKPDVHYFKLYPFDVQAQVTAFDQNAHQAMIDLCLSIPK